MTVPLIEARNLTKRFGAVLALDAVSFSLAAGRVSAVVGENGAGKSTLAKILAGVYHADTGEVFVNGVPVSFRGRRDAIASSVGFVPQALSFIGTMSVVENHLLSGRGLRADRPQARRALREANAELGLNVHLDRPVEELSLAERQLGEIASAVAAGARVLLLDEPTSTLGPAEIARLIGAIRRLALRGTAVGLVTHRIREVLEGADHVTVLRQGVCVFDGETAGLETGDVARMMVGDRDRSRPQLPEVKSTWTRLSAEGLGVTEAGHTLLSAVDLAVREGEIVGVAGVSGPAQPALAEALAGLRPLSAGRVLVDGLDISGDARKATAGGLAYVPEDRRLGLDLSLPVAENASVLRLGDPEFRYLGMRRPAAERRLGEAVIARFDVRPPRPELPAGNLSGGNQQKLLVGRELERNPAVVIAHGPTQGLDLAAAAAVRADLVAMASQGAAVLVISADLDEILDISHRIVVIAGGRVTGRFALDEPIDMRRLGQAMAAADTLEAA